MYPKIPFLFLFLFLIALWLLFPAHAKCGDKEPSSPKQTIEQFYNSLTKGDVDSAVNDLIKSNRRAFLDPDGSAKIRSALNQLATRGGGIKKRSVIIEQNIDDVLYYHKSWVIYQEQPAWFEIVLYKPEDTWIFYNFELSIKPLDELRRVVQEKQSK